MSVTIKYKTAPATVWFLEMHSRPEIFLPEKKVVEISLLPKPITAEVYRKFYFGVGEKWNWLDRMVMPDEELEQKINSGNTEIFILKVGNENAGYVEINHQKNYSEIQYFGLFPDFVGKGYGKYFLQWAILKAWNYSGTELIKLNTCSLDHSDALPIYKSCGFKVVNIHTELRKILLT